MLLPIVLTAIGIVAILLASILSAIGGPGLDLNAILGAALLVGGALLMAVLALVRGSDEAPEP